MDLTQHQPDWSPNRTSTDEERSNDESSDVTHISDTEISADRDCMVIDCSKDIKDMSVSEFCDFLGKEGIPEKFCDVFKENYVDGEVFLTLTENEVKSMVPPIGLSRKIIRYLPNSEIISQPGNSSFTSSVSTPSTISVSSSKYSAISSVSNQDEIKIPEHWRPEVEQCLKDKVITERARNEIIRTLVNILFSRSLKPCRYECDILARKLILVYPFIKDDMGNGYQSWSDRMVERIRNVFKRDRKSSSHEAENGPEAGPSKHRKRDREILRRYPVTTTDAGENAETIEVHKKAIDTELAKKKPRDSIILPLMKSTFNERRIWITNVVSAVSDLLKRYPAMSRLTVIEQEMNLIFDKPGFKAQFLASWSKYVQAIIVYAENSSKKCVSSQLAVLNRDDETSRDLTALKVLHQCLGKGKDTLCYVYEEYEAMDVDSVCKKPPKRTQPRIAALKGEENTMYIIVCEEMLLTKVSSLKLAIFCLVAFYYCFNLEYPQPLKNVFYFLQDYILGQPDSSKKSANYLAIVSDIKRNVPD